MPGTGKTLTMRPVCTMVDPMRPREVRPKTGDRCPWCHRTAPRSDKIPCGLCSPYGPTTIDEHGVTHSWDRPCPTVRHTRWGDVVCRLFPVVSVSPIDCMTCIVRATKRT